MGVAQLVRWPDIDAALARVEAGESTVEDANLLRGYIAGLQRGAMRCVYCGDMVPQTDAAVRQHIERECTKHYVRQIEERLAIYEDSLV